MALLVLKSGWYSSSNRKTIAAYWISNHLSYLTLCSKSPFDYGVFFASWAHHEDATSISSKEQGLFVMIQHPANPHRSPIYLQVSGLLPCWWRCCCLLSHTWIDESHTQIHVEVPSFDYYLVSILLDILHSADRPCNGLSVFWMHIADKPRLSWSHCCRGRRGHGVSKQTVAARVHFFLVYPHHHNAVLTLLTINMQLSKSSTSACFWRFDTNYGKFRFIHVINNDHIQQSSESLDELQAGRQVRSLMKVLRDAFSPPLLYVFSSPWVTFNPVLGSNFIGFIGLLKTTCKFENQRLILIIHTYECYD